MTDMTSRQRVITALNHEEPDRVPLDFGTGGNNSPVPEFYARLTAYYGLPAEMKYLPHYLRIVEVDERILRDLGIDTRHILMKPTTAHRRPCDLPGQFYDEFGARWKEVDTGDVMYRELAESPLADATIDDLAKYEWWPYAGDPARVVGLREQAQRMYNETDFAIVGAPGFNGMWERAWYMIGMQRALEGLLLEPEFMHALLRRITDACKIAVGHYLDAVGPYLQVIKLSDDLGAQDGPEMSPAAYRNIIKPYHKELFDFVKARTPARIFFHTCGSVYRLLPDLIDAGVEILNPVQVSAKDMDTKRLKAEFGDRLSFNGAIDTQWALPFGTVDDVKREVEHRIADLAPGGGYIMCPVHNVQSDVPPVNLITMFHHAHVVGRYSK
jgi:uroporphyrinogen decarboxylase